MSSRGKLSKEWTSSTNKNKWRFFRVVKTAKLILWFTTIKKLFLPIKVWYENTFGNILFLTLSLSLTHTHTNTRLNFVVINFSLTKRSLLRKKLFLLLEKVTNRVEDRPLIFFPPITETHVLQLRGKNDFGILWFYTDFYWPCHLRHVWISLKVTQSLLLHGIFDSSVKQLISLNF